MGSASSAACFNCGDTHQFKFCPNCGAKRNHHDGSEIGAEVFHFLTHFESRLLHTIAILFKDPAKLIHDYVRGLRAPYFPPVRFLLLTATVSFLAWKLTSSVMDGQYGMYQFMKDTFIANEGAEKAFIEANFELFFNQFHSLLATLYKAIFLLSVPLSSVFSLLLFRRLKFQFLDHLRMNMYLASQIAIVELAFTPLFWLLPINVVHLNYLMFIPTAVYMTFFYAQVSRPEYAKHYWRGLGFAALNLASWALLQVFIGMALMIYLRKTMPPFFQ